MVFLWRVWHYVVAFAYVPIQYIYFSGLSLTQQKKIASELQYDIYSLLPILHHTAFVAAAIWSSTWRITEDFWSYFPLEGLREAGGSLFIVITSSPFSPHLCFLGNQFVAEEGVTSVRISFSTPPPPHSSLWWQHLPYSPPSALICHRLTCFYRKVYYTQRPYVPSQLSFSWSPIGGGRNNSDIFTLFICSQRCSNRNVRQIRRVSQNESDSCL